ncbi:MAG TPA: nuclear transport factor 2 family protein [Sporichthyaceae bacterium]|jgi:ketosteroid isomerase-like protein|nr:nuclear transport factor 2 family protein [Sporichthyaceae bacterium]
MTGRSRNRRIVEAFYAAIPARDSAGVSAVLADGFAPDAVMRVSDSLPYGGVHRGRDVIERMLLTLLRTATPMVLPESIRVLRVAEDGDQIAVEVQFDWLAPGTSDPIAMSATEWLTFRDHRVVELKVGYWDTAACLAAIRLPTATEQTRPGVLSSPLLGGCLTAGTTQTYIETARPNIR